MAPIVVLQTSRYQPVPMQLYMAPKEKTTGTPHSDDSDLDGCDQQKEKVGEGRRSKQPKRERSYASRETRNGLITGCR